MAPTDSANTTSVAPLNQALSDESRAKSFPYLSPLNVREAQYGVAACEWGFIDSIWHDDSSNCGAAQSSLDRTKQIASDLARPPGTTESAPISHQTLTVLGLPSPDDVRFVRSRTGGASEASDSNPTAKAYRVYQNAFDYINEVCFGGKLPRCLITMQRRKNVYGYFSAKRFISTNDSQIVHEIALNPTLLAERGEREGLSTLTHEMAHLWQFVEGTPSRSGYHNREWSSKMRSIGLIPSDTGKPGGKDVGHSMSDYIEDGGRFDRVCAELIAAGFVVPYVELIKIATAEPVTGASNYQDAIRVREIKAASKTRYSCPGCRTNVWGKPNLSIVCGRCDLRFAASRVSPESG
jgi:predicted SprT family Zn-dependent metalloprotease